MTRAQALATYFQFLELRHKGEIHQMTGRVAECPVDEMNRPRRGGNAAHPPGGGRGRHADVWGRPNLAIRSDHIRCLNVAEHQQAQQTAQLRLARPLAANLRHPGERPARPGRLAPALVRRGFRNIRAKAAQPAGAPRPGKPGLGRPPESKNRRPAPSHDVGKPPRGNSPLRRVKNTRVNDKLR